MATAGWREVVAGFLRGRPACPDCGAPTRAAREDLIHAFPPVLETRYRCPRCSEQIVRRVVVEVW